MIGGDLAAQLGRPPAAGQGVDALHAQSAAQGVTLVDRAGVVAPAPAEHRHKVGQRAASLGEREPDGVSAVDEPTTAGLVPGLVVVGQGRLIGPRPRLISWQTMTLRWISLVPSPTIISGASRKYRSTSNSVE